MYSREELVNILKSGIVRVVFTKANGEERIMLATLVQDYIPQPEQLIGEANNPKRVISVVSQENIRVYDTEVKAWRSFRVDSVKEIKVNA